MQFRFYILGLLALSLSTALSCSGKTKSKTTESASSDNSGSPPVATTAKPFVLKLFTQYDNTEYTNQLTFAETGTDECSVSATSPTATCTATIHEGRLYYSSLNFQFSWLSGDCKLLFFQPYYYKADSTAAYYPPGSDSSIDCTATPIPAKCFGGAALDIVTDFPRFRANIYLPDETTPTTALSATEKVTSAASNLYGSNRWTVNDMAAGKTGTAASSADLGGQGDGYIANTYVDYTFTCRDDWYDPVTYTVNLRIRDEDSDAGNPVINNFFTWKEWL